jgi:DNA-binding MarR family transcriptional regulator
MPKKAEDHVDRLRAQWARELPEVDTAGMAVLGRARRIALALRPEIEAVFARHGLDAGTFDVVGTLRRAGPPYRLRPTELHSSLMVSSGGMTDRLDRLTRAGLVRRVADPEDGRSLLVELTERGRSLSGQVFREDMALEAEVLSALSATERKQLAELLRRLALVVEGRMEKGDGRKEKE